MMQIPARNEHDITAPHPLDASATVDPELDRTGLDDVQTAGTGETDRKALRRTMNRDLRQPGPRLLDLHFTDYAAASAAAAEAGPLVAATREHATGGVLIAFAEILEDAQRRPGPRQSRARGCRRSGPGRIVHPVARHTTSRESPQTTEGETMNTATEQDRILRAPRIALDRARQDPETWKDLAFHAEHGAGDRMTDRHRAARFAVLWALQYDRRPQDLPLLRFLLTQQTTYYREAVRMGMAPDLTLAGFLLAEHRQAEDLWLHWDAKNISFDTALGYHLYHLLTAGIATATEEVRAGSHPDRDRILHDITATRHTDAAVEEWLTEQRTRFPADPADEALDVWANHAARLGEREASRHFILEWAAGRPRTDSTLNTLQYHLDHLGYPAEAVAVQQENVAIPDPFPGAKIHKLFALAQLQRRTDDFPGAWHSVQEIRRVLSPKKHGMEEGKWRHFVKECFLLVPIAPHPTTASQLLAVAEHELQGIPRLWMDGVLDAACAAAEHLGDRQALDRYGVLREAADREREAEIGPLPRRSAEEPPAP
ncbi:hypothetical protein [Nocardia sp. alder85J]|uniref:hypothetical protein n=1 Tax=Nocardia sp. alder85J TaxID=2862949 RepID=UPI00224EFEB4|nr:hypothetical protein [Nocardia sp. alder85J]MCX4098573.1 hypothetical protein [Nocardia sp. alder85J]